MIDVAHLFGKTSAGGAKLQSAFDVATALLDEQMVAAIPCESFGAPNYLRLSYAISNEDIQTGLQRIQTFVRSVH